MNAWRELAVSFAVVIAVAAGSPSQAVESAAAGVSDDTHRPNEILASYPTENPSFVCPLHYRGSDVPNSEFRDVEGRAWTACRTDKHGRSLECTWVNDNPPSLGFGLLAAHSACAFPPHRPTGVEPSDGLVVANEYQFSAAPPLKPPTIRRGIGH